MTLDQMKPRSEVRIKKLSTPGKLAQRSMDMEGRE